MSSPFSLATNVNVSPRSLSSTLIGILNPAVFPPKSRSLSLIVGDTLVMIVIADDVLYPEFKPPVS